MRCWTFLWAVVAALLVAAPVYATTITATMDSGAFSYQLNDSAATADFTVSNVTDDGGGIMGYSAQSLINSPTWITMAGAGTLIAQGYTVEFRARVDVNGDTFGLGAMMGDGSKLCWVGARPDYVFSQWPYTNHGGGVNNDAFHVFRFARVAGDANLSIWKDGSLLTESGGLYDYTDAFSNFGQISQNAGSGQIDYFRWTTGAYAPVPEPSTLVLGCVGLVGLLAYAWRKHK